MSEDVRPEWMPDYFLALETFVRKIADEDYRGNMPPHQYEAKQLIERKPQR